MSGTWSGGGEPELFRMPVTITGKMHPVPEPPEGPRLFGLADNCATVEIGLAHSGRTREEMRDRCTIRLNLTAMSDGRGVVLSAGLTLKDRDGETVECMSAMIDRAEAERVGAAVAALFQLTPKPGESR